MFTTFYRNTAKVLKAFQLQRERAFLSEIPEVPIPPALLETVQFNIQELIHQHSEYIIQLSAAQKQIASLSALYVI